MAVTSGFYDSLAGDRTYNADQLSSIFDGIINDGIFGSIGESFAVSENSGMNLSVGIGRAWFNRTWTYNDAPYGIEIDPSEVVLDRIDTVVIEVNSDPSIRLNTIKAVKGTPSSTPVAPTLTNENHVHQYPLCDVYISAGVTDIVQANITNRIGTTDTPLITGILETMTIDAIIAQWDGEWTDWTELKRSLFETWFNNLEDMLDENAETNLQNQINDINTKIRYVQLVPTEWATLNIVKTGAHYLIVPPDFDGYNLVYIHAWVVTPGNGGTMALQLRNRTTLTNMLSTQLTIDSGEQGSQTAAVPAVISSLNKEVSASDVLRLDIESIHSTTAAKGLIVTLGFQTPTVV